MKGQKAKSHDEVPDVSGLKTQLGSVLKEIVAFTERLEESKVRENDFGYTRCFDYETRVQELKNKLHPGKDPAKPVIFLARMVVECLNKGPMSEKDIKNAVLERCKELGIKSSNRGLIAGTGMDVATVCNVLGVLGALEQTTVESGAAVKSEPSSTQAASSTASTSSAAAVHCDPATITGPGAELYKALSERWHPRLTEYFEDALKNKQASMNSDNSSVTKAEASSSESTAVASVAVPPVVTPVVPVVPQMSHTARLIAEYRSGNTENLNARAHLNANKTSQKSLDNYFAPSKAGNNSHAVSAASVAITNIAAVGSSSSGAGGTVSAQQASHPAGAAPVAPTSGSNVPQRVPSLVQSEASAVSALAGMDHKAGAANGASSGPSALPPPPSLTPNISIPPTSAPSGAYMSSNMNGNMNSSTTLAGGPSFPGSSIAMHSVPAAAPTASTAGVPSIGAGAATYSTYPAQAGMTHSTLAPAGSVQAPVLHSLSSVPSVPSLSLLSSGINTSIGSGLNSSITLQPPLNIQPFVSPLSVSMGDIAAQAPAPATTGKAKAKAKPANEKKPTKKSLKEAATAQAASAAATATANANKIRRGPSALRVWKLRDDFAACYNSISTAQSSTHNSAHNNTQSAVPSSHSAHNSISANITSAIVSNSHSSTDHTTATSSSSSNNTAMKAELKSAAAKLLLQPAQLLQAAALAQYEHSAALELEEKLLRRLAGQCNLTLKASRYRVGTTYLSADPDIMSQPVGNQFRQSTLSSLYTTNTTVKPNGSQKLNVSDSGDDYFKYPDDEELETNYALFDDNVNITAAYLLEKVRRTKRQRGDVLYGNITLPVNHTLSASASAARAAAAASVGVFSAAHVHSLSAVCNKTAEFYWNTAPSSPRTGSKHKKAPPLKAPVNEPITMAQYARNLHIGATGPVPVVLSSCSNGSSITAHTLRRYAQPLDLVGGHLPMLDMSKKETTFAAATGGAHSSASATNALIASNNGSEVLRIPDLALRTREIAWTEIAQEFQVLPPPTEDLAPGLNNTASDAPPEPPKEKKRKYLQNHDSATTSHSSSGKLAAEGLISVEVLAPQFREIVPITTIAQQHQAAGDVASVEDTTGDEDLSDEAVSVRHEAVLKAMRDKWSLLQQLKNEALYGPGGVPPEGTRGGNYRGGGGGGYGYFGGRPAGRAASVSGTGAGIAEGAAEGLQSALTLPIGDSAGVVGGAGKFQNLSPRKRGLASAHAKRRGRPPKAAKLHHHHHNSHSNAQNVHNSSSTALDASSGAGHRNNSDSADHKATSESFEMQEDSEGED